MAISVVEAREHFGTRRFRVVGGDPGVGERGAVGRTDGERVWMDNV